MGRTMPSSTLLPNHTRRAERAMRAKESIRKAIPEMLRSYPRARHGVHKAERIVDPSANAKGQASVAPGKTHIKIRLCCSDTLSAAASLSSRVNPQSKSSAQQNIAILNFASPLRPGGGFLDGANSQEEFLCARTTLYPSLWDSFYRLPELGGVYTPDVLVFRDSTPDANELRKNERYFIDVISSGMLRFPDVNQQAEEDGEPACTCGVSYCDRDRELVTDKMRAVLRIAESKGHKTLVLGAWGCGAYGNPVAEVAKIWRKVIAGNVRQRRPLSETWSSISEIVFAIPDRNMLHEFELAFKDILSPESLVATKVASEPDGARPSDNELLSTIVRTEARLASTNNVLAKQRLREVLVSLHAKLEQEEAAKKAHDSDLTLQEDEEAEELGSSDPDASNVYNFDENDIASDSSDGEHSEIYEFQASGPEPSEPSPHFDAQTGWFNGSMDELSRMLRLSTPDKDVATPSTPDGESYTFNERAVDAYLSKYGGTDVNSAPSSVQ